MARRQIALLTSANCQDRMASSGVPYHTAQALQKHCGDVTLLGPMFSPVTRILEVADSITRQLSGKKVLTSHSYLLAQHYALQAQKKLKKQKIDIIFASKASTELAFLKTNVPVIYATDATFDLLHEYYESHSNLLSFSVRCAEDIERRAIHKAKMLIYHSQWAAQSAINHYGADPQQIHILPIASNLDNPPSFDWISNKNKSSSCKLLLVGLSWIRKGADIALETLIALEKMGIPAELTVCGCKPPAGIFHEKLKVIPYLNKNNAQQRDQLEQLFKEATFFIMPSRAECFGIVFCEANAYGLPVLGAATGGVPEAISDGVNGFLLPYDARGDAYAKKIREIYLNDHLYRQLVLSSRKTYDEKTTWDGWGKKVNTLLEAFFVNHAGRN